MGPIGSPDAAPQARPGPPERPTRLLRRGPGSAYRAAQSVRFLLTRDRRAVLSLVGPPRLGGLSRRQRVGLLRRLVRVTNQVRGYHTLAELLAVVQAILERAGRPDLTIVEAGCAHGGATAKLSLAAAAAGGRVHAFDSFRGIPENDEEHVSLDGRRLVFTKGAFRATVPQVRRTLARVGAPEAVTLHPGLFEDTLPDFRARIDVALLDVDLLASTRTCLVHLFPQLAPDGVLFSHDGHVRAVCELVGSDAFWRDEVGVEPPRVQGLGVSKLIALQPRGAA